MNAYTHRLLRPLATALLFALAATPAVAAPFTYHGELIDGDAPAEGAYDLRVRSFASPNAKASLGEATELPNVKVANGSFSLQLDLPENPLGDTYVEVAIRKAGSGDQYETLGAPQTVSKVNTGCWALDGNTGLPAGSFLGIADTADATPLVLRARNSTVAVFHPFVSPDVYGDAAAVVLGSSANQANSYGATVAGGGSTRTVAGAACPTCRNYVENPFGTVGGGQSNSVEGSFATIAGGSSNTANGQFAVVAGGSGNAASITGAAIGGGTQNQATAFYTTVGAGYQNRAEGDYAVIGGGLQNTGYDYSAIGGGAHNLANNYSAISGGSYNEALGNRSAIAGGLYNATQGDFAVAAGGENNYAGGAHSFAAGRRAVVRAAGTSPNPLPFPRSTLDYTGTANGDDGSWVWSDSQSNGSVFRSSGPNQFLVRAAGGAALNTNTIPNFNGDDLVIGARAAPADADVDLRLVSRSGKQGLLFLRDGDGGYAMTAPQLTGADFLVFGNNARLTAGGVFTNASSRELKHAFAAVDASDILARVLSLPITTWSYKASSEGRHLGPVAEDFKQAFGLAGDGRSIPTVDADGVALAAIQGLNAKLERESAVADTRIATLERDNLTLRAQLQTVLARLDRLTAAKED